MKRFISLVMTALLLLTLCVPALAAGKFEYASFWDEDGNESIPITDLTSDSAKANSVSSALDVTGLSFRKDGKDYAPTTGDAMTLLASDTDNNFSGLGLKYNFNGTGETKTETLTAAGVTVAEGE